MLLIKNLNFSYPTHKVFKNLSLTLKHGEIGTLIGSSGSGKTTLFKILTGTVPLQEGSIHAVTSSPPEAYQLIAYMMQEDLLLPWRTILENLLLVNELGEKKETHKNFEEKALFYLNEVNLRDWANAYPKQLSGGMKQRVCLARSLLLKKPILLLDEPFASLDAVLREQMHELLMRIRKKYETTILLITHDFRDALALSDRIFLLKDSSIAHEWIIDDSLRHEPEELFKLTKEIKTQLCC